MSSRFSTIPLLLSATIFLLVYHPAQAQTDIYTIKVDWTKRKGPMKPIWAYFGYDEPNYTYMKDGRKLLSELSALSPVPVRLTGGTYTANIHLPPQAVFLLKMSW